MIPVAPGKIEAFRERVPSDTGAVSRVEEGQLTLSFEVRAYLIEVLFVPARLIRRTL